MECEGEMAANTMGGGAVTNHQERTALIYSTVRVCMCA